METKQADRKMMDNLVKPKPAQARKRISLQDMHLHTRLALLILAISIFVVVLSIAILLLRAGPFLQQITGQQLALENNGVAEKIETWIDMNVRLLKQMAALDDISSMDPARQQTVLEKTVDAFPYIYLAHTLDTAGFNIARSDGQSNRDYSHREYYQQVMKGEPVAYQVVIGASSNRPALIIAVPIKNNGKVVGVMSIACELEAITQDVMKDQVGQEQMKATTFIVDPNGNLIAYTGEETTPSTSTTGQVELVSYANVQPVMALKQGERGLFEYKDEKRESWIAYLSQTENGWGVITQQERNAIFAAIGQFQFMTLLLILAGAIFIAVLSQLFIRRTLRPMQNLYETVMAMTAGDLTKVALVERNDEIGQLAQAFNELTSRLRVNIVDLEQRVQDRTRAMTLSTEISRRVSTILDMDRLTREVVSEVQHTFDYYHVHIYLFDEAQQNLVMVGGTGEAGQVMLARKHRIPSGRGLVGRAAATNTPVLVSDTTKDPGWLPNPLLPETKSELAVPIATSDRILGVLDVQQNVMNGLTEIDVDVIQLTANQVAIALQNAMAYAKAQQKAERETLVASLGQKIQQATTIDEVLKVTLRELGGALGAQHSSVEIRSEITASDGNIRSQKV